MKIALQQAKLSGAASGGLADVAGSLPESAR